MVLKDVFGVVDVPPIFSGQWNNCTASEAETDNFSDDVERTQHGRQPANSRCVDILKQTFNTECPGIPVLLPDCAFRESCCGASQSGRSSDRSSASSLLQEHNRARELSVAIANGILKNKAGFDDQNSADFVLRLYRDLTPESCQARRDWSDILAQCH